MRYLLAAVAAVAVCGLIDLAPAQAQMMYNAGGPVRQGNMCQVATQSDAAYGYWVACPAQAPVARHAKKMKS